MRPDPNETIDNAGRLIVAGGTSPAGILVFSAAAAASGYTAPAATSTLTGVRTVEIAVAGNGDLYTTDFSDFSVKAYANIASASGALAPVRVIQGTSTGLNTPTGFLTQLTGIAVDPAR